MVNACINYKPFEGYFFNLGSYNLHLMRATINFYESDGSIVPMRLDDGCSFWLNTKAVDFKVRRSKNFSRNEIFAIKHTEYGRAAWEVYVPMDSVNLSYNGEIEQVIDDGYHISKYRSYLLEVEYFGYLGEPEVKHIEAIGNMVKFSTNHQFVPTKKQKVLDKIQQEIEETCGVKIYDYELKKILEHYKFVKK